MRRRNHTGVRRPLRDENGQAMVEFAIILLPLLLLVAGIIQFGIALNFWLDENRIANQGARQAVVNHWPGCPRLPATPACTGANALDQYLTRQAISQGLQDNVVVSICFPPTGDPSVLPGMVGAPVRIRLQTSFDLLPILGVGSLALTGEATMRLEQEPTHFIPTAAWGTAPCT